MFFENCDVPIESIYIKSSRVVEWPLYYDFFSFEPLYSTSCKISYIKLWFPFKNKKLIQLFSRTKIEKLENHKLMYVLVIHYIITLFMCIKLLKNVYNIYIMRYWALTALKNQPELCTIIKTISYFCVLETLYTTWSFPWTTYSLHL